MENREKNNPDEEHDLPPQDEVTKNKIDKHLSDINDTISEQDIKNINTSISTDPDALMKEHLHDKDEADEILKKKPDDDEPEQEAPTPWNILGS